MLGHQTHWKYATIAQIQYFLSSSFGKWSSCTHSNPTKKRSTNIMFVFIENAERNEQMKPSISDIRMTFWRPHVSAIKPQKCELITMPRNETDVNRPCSLVVNCKSHFAYGSINATLIFSRTAPIKLKPVANVINTWNFPNSKIGFKKYPEHKRNYRSTIESFSMWKVIDLRVKLTASSNECLSAFPPYSVNH